MLRENAKKTCIIKVSTKTFTLPPPPLPVSGYVFETRKLQHGKQLEFFCVNYARFF